MRSSPVIVLVLAGFGLACSGAPGPSEAPAATTAPAPAGAATPTPPAALAPAAPADPNRDAEAEDTNTGSTEPPVVDPSAVASETTSHDEISGAANTRFELSRDVVIHGVPCARGVADYDGEWDCTLAAATTAHGVELKPGRRVIFDDSGAVTSADVPSPVQVDGFPCRDVVKWQGDRVSFCYLAEDRAFASGLTLPAGLGVYFEDGRPVSSELSDPVTIGGVAYEAGHTLTFSADGKVEDEGETPGE